MRVLIVFAHAERSSFNGSMLRAGVAALTAAGHEVEVSDLCAMGFDPVSDRRNFVTIANPAELRQQAEEALASSSGGFVPSLQAEMDKLAWCDVLVFQFPIWWLGLPAILKGWVDRVFAVGRAYGGGRWFEGGFFAGKRAMCAVSVGGLEDVYSSSGVYAPIEEVLFPIHRGIFAFTGFSVVAPFVVYGPGRIDVAAREAYLNGYIERLLTLDTAPLLVNEKGSAPAFETSTRDR
ncbi:NAD(P)H-dependent oxidoreductase [soil metagenome]